MPVSIIYRIILSRGFGRGSTDAGGCQCACTLGLSQLCRLALTCIARLDCLNLLGSSQSVCLRPHSSHLLDGEAARLEHVSPLLD